MEKVKPVFFKSTKGQYGELYNAVLNGVEVRANKTKSGDLAVTVGDKKEFLKPKAGQYGEFFMLTVGEDLFFIKEKENSRGKYLQANKGTKKREQRPASYGGREAPQA